MCVCKEVQSEEDVQSKTDVKVNLHHTVCVAVLSYFMDLHKIYRDG